jgi:hypothetical protein
MLRSWGPVFALILGTAACGGTQKPPEAPARAEPVPSALEPREPAPDLSPVGAPAGLFVVGRFQQPLAQVDTLGNWLGIPGRVLNFVPERYEGLVASIDGDAPIELAVVYTGAKRSRGDWVASLGLKSLAQAVEEARAIGAEIQKKAPGVMSVAFGRGGPKCAIALSLGRAPARLVCAETEAALDAQLPFATRGLPTMPLGSRELELELRLPPLREAFAKEVAGAGSFATFVARQLELDDPRVDRATADTVKALFEELVQLSEDVDVLALGGNVDEAKGELALGLDFRFRSQKSLIAGVLQDGSRQGPPPDVFFALPGAAESGGYTRGFDPARWSGVRARGAELVDAFLEHEKVGKPSRDRAKRLIDTYFTLDGVRAFANLPSANAENAAGTKGTVGNFVQILENPSKTVLESFLDMHGFIEDRQVRAALAKRIGLPVKALPKASLVPVRGAGLPAGTRALVVKLPKDFYDGVYKVLGPKGLGPKSRGNEPPEFALVAVPRGEGTAVAMAATAPEAAKLLGELLTGKVPTLRERPELLRFERVNAVGGYFVTLGGIVTALAESTGNPSLKSTGPASATPLFGHVEVQKGVTSVRVTVPKGVFGGFQALVPALIR